MISSLVSFIVCLIALAMAKVPYYGLIALGLAVLDLIPVLGSGIVLIPWAIISFIAGDTQLVITLIILFVATFLIDQILEPIILGKSVGLKPIYTLLITVAAMLILSPALGAIVGSIASIIVAVIIDMKQTRKEN